MKKHFIAFMMPFLTLATDLHKKRLKMFLSNRIQRRSLTGQTLQAGTNGS